MRSLSPSLLALAVLLSSCGSSDPDLQNPGADIVEPDLVITRDGAPRNAPYDFVASRSGRTYADLVTQAGLKEVATYADVVAPYKEVIIPRTALNQLGAPSGARP